MTTAGDDQRLNHLMARIQSILAERTADAADEALIRAFEELVVESVRPGDGLTALRNRINHLPGSLGGRLIAGTTSRVPGGSLMHRLVGKATERHDTEVLNRVRVLAEEIRTCLLDAIDLDMGPLAARLARIGADLEATADEVASLSAAVGRLDDVEERLSHLERFERDRGFRPWFSQVEFGDAFRGSRGSILDRYHDIAEILAGPGGPVLDLGCGRGELVELLITRGVEARGVELDPELVDFCRSISLDVSLADAASALEDQKDGALGGAALIQVVEHLTPQQLLDLIPRLFRKLRPGGVVVAETVNATSPYVFTQSFYLDPTHTNPIHPSYLEFLFRHAGFRDVEVRWRSLVPNGDRIPPLDADDGPSAVVTQANAGIEKLNQFLFGPQDYALLATR